MSVELAPQVRIAQRVDRLEARIAKAREAAKEMKFVEVLEHELSAEIHITEIDRLATKYEVPINIEAILHFAIRDRAE